MAIAFDAKTNVSNTAGNTHTFSHTCSGTDRVLYVFGHDTNTVGPTIVTGVTYNGVSMTKVTELDANASFNDRAITMWRLVAPATGANNVVVTTVAGNNLRFASSSYTGVDQTTPENGTDTSTGTSVATISTDITTTEADCWMLQFSKDQNGGRTYTNTTGDTIRNNADAGGHMFCDTDASFGAGSNTITNTMTSVNGIGALAVAIRPVAAAATFIPQIRFY
jgi:hypothetical protein